jgi:hypothetical protein
MGKLVEVKIKLKWATNDNDRKFKMHWYVCGIVGNLEDSLKLRE